LGTKGKMGQVYVKGMRIPVTKLSVGPSVVTQYKTQIKDGYWAMQLGFSEKKIKNISKPVLGHLKGATKNNKAPRFLREVRVDKEESINVGDQVKVSDIFRVGDIVSVRGLSKGKGFAGVVKRWHFAGGPKTHGQSDRQRAPGSIGQGTTPGRVLKGKRMAGRMGSDMVTLGGLHVISIDAEKGEMLVSGPVPGRSGGLLIIKKTSSGSLEELEQETVVQVVEGEKDEEEKSVVNKEEGNR